MLFLCRAWLMLYDLRPYLLSIGGLNIKMEQVSFIPVFFDFLIHGAGKGHFIPSTSKKVNSGLDKKVYLYAFFQIVMLQSAF